MFKDKVALVTGGSKGIGQAICLELASKGANIVVNYSKSPESAEKVVQECLLKGVKAISLKADVSKALEVENLFKASLNIFGRIDILVNNAGTTKDNLILRMSEEDFDTVIDTNLKGTFLCTKLVSKIMLKQRYGRIINISSVVGLRGNAGQANYSASKAGIIGLTKSLAKELGAKGITVNAVAPGFIETEMTQNLPLKTLEEMLQHIPLKRAGYPEEVAKVVSFLTDEACGYITGQVIGVDGGMII